MKSRGFSLVEVVLALALFAFVAVALVGLVSVGIDTNRESAEELESTNLIRSFFAARGAAPVAAEIAKCPLPRLDLAAEITPSSPLYLREDGSPADNPETARFGLLYKVSPPSATRRFSTAYVCLFWPPQAEPRAAQGRNEMTRSFLLP